MFNCKCKGTAKYSLGSVVTHKTNSEVSMVIVDVDDDVDEKNEIDYKCRWITKNGKRQSKRFLEVELA